MTTLHADDAFLSYYQFSHDPFAARVPGFKFFPAQRKPVLGQLHHLARYSQLLLLVCGPLGSGKTLLRQALVASTNKQLVQSLVLSARDSVQAGGIFRQVAAGLEAVSASAEAVLAKAGQLALTGQEVYLLVDDAEQLDDAALEALLVLAAGNSEGRLHVFLFAESSLVDRIEQLVGGDERCHSIELSPYTESETRDYLAQRLEGAGQDIDVFSPEQIEDIHLQSEGWPGGINEVARDVLLDAMLHKGGQEKAGGALLGLPKKHALALLVVVVAVAAAWFMQGQPSDDGQDLVARDAVPVTAPVAPVDAVDEAPAIEFAGASSNSPMPSSVEPVVRDPLAQAAGQGEAEDEQSMPMEPLAPVIETPVETTTSLPLPPTVTIPLPVVDKPVPSAVPPVAVVEPVKPAVKTPEKVAKAPVTAAKSTVVSSEGSAASAWYRTQAGERVTLQVLGTGVEQNAQAFVRQMGSEYHYYVKSHQGRSLYVVTYGVFSTRSAAQAALKGLPAKVQAGKPFPKSFASIQKEMLIPR